METAPSNILNVNPLVTQTPGAPDAIGVQEISDADFKRFIFSGYVVHIPVPTAKTTSHAWFAINLEGFIPAWNSRKYYQWLMNHSPVQITGDGKNISDLKITKEMIAPPIIHSYLSNRFMSGQVGVGIRITSQTSQAGTFEVTQTVASVRKFVKSGERYEGLRFLNASTNGNDYMVNGFALIDLSLNRQFSITGLKRSLNKMIDFPFKWKHTVGDTTSEEDFVAQMFPEDWFLLTPRTSLENNVPNTVHFSIYFDYSQCQFYQPLIPIIPLNPISLSMQILDVSKSINDKGIHEETYEWLSSGTVLKGNHYHARVLQIKNKGHDEIVALEKKQLE